MLYSHITILYAMQNTVSLLEFTLIPNNWVLKFYLLSYRLRKLSQKGEGY